MRVLCCVIVKWSAPRPLPLDNLNQPVAQCAEANCLKNWIYLKVDF